MCECPALAAFRAAHGPDLLRSYEEVGVAPPPLLLDALSTGLFPLPRLALDPNHRPPPAGSFRWVYRDEDCQVIRGRIYTDASRIIFAHPDTVRLGWALVAVNDDNVITAIARGTPPDYIDDIPAAEAWALVQATTFAASGSTFFSDCKPCVDGIAAGRKASCGANRPLARVLGRIFDNIGPFPDNAFVWMPPTLP